MADNVVKSFSLHSEHDKALLAQLGKLKRGDLSPLVRDALNEYFAIHNGVTLTDVYQSIKAIERQLSNGAVSIESQSDQGDDVGDDVGDDIKDMFK